MTRLQLSTTGVSLAFFLAACSSSNPDTQPPLQTGGTPATTGGSSATGPVGGTTATSSTTQTGQGGSSTNTTNTGTGAGGTGSTATSNSGVGGTGSTAAGGKSGVGGTGSTSSNTSAGGKTSTSTTSAGGSGPVGGSTSAGGVTSAGGNASGGSSAKAGGAGGASGGSSGTATGGTTTTTAAMTVFTSDGKSDATNGKVVTPTEVTTGNADVTVNDTSTAQNWDGWGGSFNEMGWDVLTSAALKDEAMKLLFGTDGAHFSWGRIPMGASDYATTRYTVDDPATPDPTAASGEANRPAGDVNLGKFSLSRDEQKLIPYIKAAQAVKSDLKFWASPWTAPVWMKTGYKTEGSPKKPSYFDGGNMSAGSGDANLKAYAQLFAKFVEGYKAKGINIEIVSPQNEPGYEQNYPSCLWDKTTYTNFIGKYLGPAMKDLNVKVMLGTMSNNGDTVAGQARMDTDIAKAVLADSTAKSFLAVAGAQWGVLGAVVAGSYDFGGLPIWATEHKCGNYPWNPQGYPAYNSSQAPNDLAYGVESWGYIRDAVTKGKVTAYSAWNMVLDKDGLGNDTTREWKQDALLVVNGGKIIKTPAYWVFRHASQFAAPGGKVVATTSGSGIESFGFKNADGGLVAVMYNSGAAKTAIVSIGGKKLSFAMPGAGWATVYVPKS